MAVSDIGTLNVSSMGCCRYQATISYSSTLLRLCTLNCALILCPLLSMVLVDTSTTTRHYHLTSTTTRHYHQYAERPCRPTLGRFSRRTFTSSVGNLLVMSSSQRRQVTETSLWHLQHASGAEINVPFYFCFPFAVGLCMYDNCFSKFNH